MDPNRSRRIALASIFGVLILVTMGFLPAPTSDFLIISEAFFLALSYLVVGRGGATYAGVVAGLLITAVKISFFPLDLVLAIFFGVMVDATSIAFGAKNGTEARTMRLVAALTLSTGLVGFTAYYVAAVLTNLVPNQLALDVTVLVFGIFSGAAGGFLAARVWNKYLSARLSR
jgi:hypothetical protein